MCGRYTLVKPAKAIEERFGVQVEKDSYHETYNAAPTQTLPVISNENAKTASYYKWGLIPFWAKDASIGNKMINARAETLAEKPAFKKSLQSKRCLVIADGFYEWQKIGKNKQPYRITLKNNDLFAFAGLWDTWKNEEGNRIYTFSIITTSPNELMEKIHDRMPVILPQKYEKEWINDSLKLEEAMAMLQPYDANAMQAYQVSTMVNSPSNNSKELIEQL